MYEKDLHEKFIHYLQLSFPSKRELTSVLADILKIERESVCRRLNGKVLFTVREIGKIALQLNISLDHLINNSFSPIFLPLDLVMPSNVDSIDSLLAIMKNNKNKIKEMSRTSDINIGHIFDSLPLEFFVQYENLCKFMYFKWMYYFLKSDFYDDYSSWKIPDIINEYHEELMEYKNSLGSVFYIWDNSVVWNLVREMDFLNKMRVIDTDDVRLIKEDLHLLLNNTESHTKGLTDGMIGKSVDLYVSSVNIGVSCIAMNSSDSSMIFYKTPFSHSTVHNDQKIFDKMYEWMNSMKKVSTLISGSGAIDRRIFFDEQHKIVEYI